MASVPTPFRILLTLVVSASFCTDGLAHEPASQDERPSVDYVLPWRVVAGDSRVRITVHGQRLEDCTVVTVRRATDVREIPAHLVSETLVFTLPDDLAATPGTLTVRIGGSSPPPNEVGIEVVKAPETTQAAEPFISKIAPGEVVVPATGTTRLLVYGENIDPEALVFLRPEGQGGNGTRLATTPATGKALIEALVGAKAAPTSGVYEVRVVNPTARQSNWVRVRLKVPTPAS
jgi:hypothetical protein